MIIHTNTFLNVFIIYLFVSQNIKIWFKTIFTLSGSFVTPHQLFESPSFNASKHVMAGFLLKNSLHNFIAYKHYYIYFLGDCL